MERRMKSIWLIEEGEYSDYHIVGVFSSKENAERMQSILAQGHDESRIVEWTLDPGIAEIAQGLRVWSVMILEDGTVTDAKLRGGIDVYPPEIRKPMNREPFLHVMRWARDQEHAIKIVNEHRTRIIALGEWKVS